MQGVFFNCFLSAVVAVLSSVGTVWYLSAHSSDASGESEPIAETLKARRIEVDSLIVNNDLLLVDSETNMPTIEMKGGSLFVQNDVFSERVGTYRVLAQKVQATPDDPLDMRSPVFGELTFTDDGGACLALTSQREGHVVTLGFDRAEKGCILSKNNDDESMVAQAVFLKPSIKDAETTAQATKPSTSDSTSVEGTVETVAEAEANSVVK